MHVVLWSHVKSRFEGSRLVGSTGVYNFKSVIVDKFQSTHRDTFVPKIHITIYVRVNSILHLWPE